MVRKGSKCARLIKSSVPLGPKSTLQAERGLGVFRETRIWFGGGIRGAFVMAVSPVLLGEIFFSRAKLCL